MNRKRGIVRWFFLLTVIFTTLGVSYAAHTNVLTGEFNFSTSSMSFIFDSESEQEVFVELYHGSGEKPKDLGGIASYEDKKLTIKEIGPIDMDDLADGGAVITIKYAIKAEDDKQGIRRPSSIESKKDNGYDLGEIEFELLSHTPIWILANGEQCWGTSTGETATPEIVYGLLPNTLGTFHGYNNLIPDEEEGVMIGTIVLEQVSCPDSSEVQEIGLSSLNLPDEIISAIKNGSEESNLQIKGNYGFEIPLNLEQFNIER